MDTPAQSPQKLPSQFKIKVNDQDRVVLMSFALLNHLCALLPSPDKSPLLLLDPDLREAALQLMFSERNKETGVVEKPFVVDTMEADMDSLEELLTWAGEHAANFTMRMVENATTIQLKHAERLQGLAEKTKASGLVSGLVGRVS